MMEEYKNSVNEQHASEELIQKTLLKMQQESVKRKTSPGTGKTISLVAAFAACLLLVFGIYRMSAEKEIIFSEVEIADSMQGSIYLGGNTQQPEALVSGLQKRVLSGDYQLPKGILEGKSYNIGKTEVYFGYDSENHICYAAYEQNEGWILLYSSRMDQKEFGNAVTKYLKNSE